MILIIGGAYQGKLDFAKENFDIADADVHICGAGDIDFSKRCIYKSRNFPTIIPTLSATSKPIGRIGRTVF